MIRPYHLPADACFDDPAEKFGCADAAENQRDLAYALAEEGLRFVAEWLTRGRNGLKHRAMRADIFLLCIHPDFLPFERRPSAAAIGRLHGVSRERARKLRNQFRDAIAPYIKFPGQRSRPQPHACSKRPGRVRRGT